MPDGRVEIARTGNAAIRYELLNSTPTGRLETLVILIGNSKVSFSLIWHDRWCAGRA